MAKKKTTPISIVQEDNIAAQHVLEHYHQVAHNLRLSTDQKRAEAAFTEINNMPEGAQIALLKALSKEHHSDAADVLLAINELSPIKSVRAELLIDKKERLDEAEDHLLQAKTIENYHQAEIFIEKAEHIDPESPDVQLARRVLALAKAVQAPNFAKLDRPKKKRRR